MRYSSRIDCLEDTSLLDAFELVETDDMISFSAGSPSAETYPLEAITESFVKVMEKSGKAAMNYSSTSGYTPLRKIISQRMKDKFDVEYSTDEIIITSGSQQGLDMSGTLFVNKGDVVLFETPSYLGAVSALRANEAKLVGVPTDNEGIKVDALKKALDKYGDKVKMIYVIPDFQNPTGRSWSLERRKAFMELVSDYEVAVIEDGAYSELSFDNTIVPPLAAFDKNGQVIYIGTFSKTFCPGLRIAWLCARNEIMEKYLLLKNAMDLSSSAIAQRQMAYYLSNYDFDAHIAEITKLYKHRRDVMIEMIEKHFPKEVKYEIPNGGLFVWLELPGGKDARDLLVRAGQHKIAFIPGTSFYPSSCKNNEFRLNFSNMHDDEIRKGMEILGSITQEFISEQA